VDTGDWVTFDPTDLSSLPSGVTGFRLGGIEAAPADRISVYLDYDIPSTAKLGDTVRSIAYTELGPLTASTTYAGFRVIHPFDWSFTKTGEDGKTLSGVEFALYASDSSEDGYSDTPLQTVSSSTTGTVSFTGLNASTDTTITYKLVETRALPGYELPQGYWLISADPDGSIIIKAEPATSLPPSFELAEGIYSVPNFRKTILPLTGNLLTRLSVAIAGVVLIDLALFLLIRKKKVPRST
jgi:hypothetical protein